MILGLKGTPVGQLSALPGADLLENLQVAELVVELHGDLFLDDHRVFVVTKSGITVYKDTLLSMYPHIHPNPVTVR
jgi:hypothetical protein